VVCQPNASLQPRLGLAIAKKAAPEANQRNRIKRLIREYFRNHQGELSGYDLVFVAQPAAARARRQELSAAIDALWKQVLARCAPP
jgi:ribonuclease P protein component